jgi:hypothetical protein
MTTYGNKLLDFDNRWLMLLFCILNAPVYCTVLYRP